MAQTEFAEAKGAVAALNFLNDVNRLRILRRLARREAYVFELADDLALPQPLVSYHLRRLREAGLVRSSRRAKRVAYALDAAAWDAFAQPIRDVCAMVERVAEDAAATDPVGTMTGWARGWRRFTRRFERLQCSVLPRSGNAATGGGRRFRPRVRPAGTWGGCRPPPRSSGSSTPRRNRCTRSRSPRTRKRCPCSFRSSSRRRPGTPPGRGGSSDARQDRRWAAGTRDPASCSTPASPRGCSSGPASCSVSACLVSPRPRHCGGPSGRRARHRGPRQPTRRDAASSRRTVPRPSPNPPPRCAARHAAAWGGRSSPLRPETPNPASGAGDHDSNGRRTACCLRPRSVAQVPPGALGLYHRLLGRLVTALYGRASASPTVSAGRLDPL